MATKTKKYEGHTVTSKIPKLSLTIACSGHLYKQKTIPRIFLHALISLVHQNTSSGILADKRPEKLVPPAFPALQSPIISSLSVCLPSSARFTLCPPPWWPGHRKCQRGFGSFVPASASTAKKHAMSSNILLLSFWVLNDVPGCYKIQKVKNSLGDFRMQIPWLRLLIPLFIYTKNETCEKGVQCVHSTDV